MAVKKRRQGNLVQTFKPAGFTGVREAFLDDAQDFGVLPQPVAPPAPRNGVEVSDDVIFMFPSGMASVEATDVIKTSGGAPVLVEEVFEGLGVRTALDPGGLMKASVAGIVRGPRAQGVHDLLMAAARTRTLCRVYGPMIGPGRQGMVWRITDIPDVSNPDLATVRGVLTRFNVQVELTEWNPIVSVDVQPGSRVSAGRSREKAKKRVRVGDTPDWTRIFS